MKIWRQKAKALGLDAEFDTKKSVKLTSHVLEDDGREIVEEFHVDGNSDEVYITSVERIYQTDKFGEMKVEIIPKPIDKEMLNIAIGYLEDKGFSWKDHEYED